MMGRHVLTLSLAAYYRELFVTRIESRPSARSGPVTTLNRPWEIVLFVDLDRPDPQRDAEAVEVRSRPIS